jgi:hypothetical protein
MGACQSIQDGDEEEKKKRSRQIDARLLEDERRLRKECKILLLGMNSVLRRGRWMGTSRNARC